MLDLTGKVAFVAGAGSGGEGWGNGKATAVLMARQGAKVYGVDINAGSLAATAEIMKQEGHTGWAGRTCNMSKSDEVKASVDYCLKTFGRIDILVNNVGGSAPGDPVSMTEEEWDGQMNLNLKTAFMGCKHVIPVMQRQFIVEGKGGAIVNLSSIGCKSYQPGGRVNAGYAASKAGVIALSRSTAIAYAKKGIRVNTVSPGTIETELVGRMLGNGESEAKKWWKNQHPVGRFGSPEEVAAAVVWLASPEASFVTGTDIAVDGGYLAQ